MWGNKVSHSNRKTSIRFTPNIQKVTVQSDALKQDLSLKVAVSTLRSIDHNGGIDNFLLKKANKDLTQKALRIKRRVKKALEKKN